MKGLRIFLALGMMMSGTLWASELTTSIDINKVMNAEDFPERTAQKLMGVDQGEILLFSSTPSESILVDCKAGPGRLNYSIYSKGVDHTQSDFAFESNDKCVAFSNMLEESKENIGVSTRVKIELDFSNLTIQSIHFSEDI